MRPRELGETSGRPSAGFPFFAVCVPIGCVYRSGTYDAGDPHYAPSWGNATPMRIFIVRRRRKQAAKDPKGRRPGCLVIEISACSSSLLQRGTVRSAHRYTRADGQIASGAAAHIPGSDLRAPALLGGARMRHFAALRHGNGGGHLPYRDVLARGRPGAVERSLCSALA